MKTTAYSCLLAAALFLGCRSEDVQITIQNEVVTSPVANLSPLDFFLPQGLLKSGNTLALLTSSSAYNAVAFDLQSGEKQGFFKRYLSASDRMTSLMSFNSTDGHTITALDYRKGRLIESILPNEVSRSATRSSERIISLPEGQQHLIAAKGSSFVIATGLYDEGRYLYYDLNNQTAQYFLDYPEHKNYPSIQTRTKAILYASNILRIRPDESAFVCADMYSGLVDFCCIVGSSIERVRTVRLHYPEVDIEERPSLDVAYYRDNRLGFADVAVSQERVYALYSGRSIENYGNDAFLGDILLIYDWEGNLLNTYHLGVPLNSISYDSIEKALYGFTDYDDNLLLKLNLSFE